MKKVILILVIILLVGVFVFSAWNVVGTLLEYREGQNFYEDLNQYVSVPEEETKPAKKHNRLPLLFKATEPTEPVQTDKEEPFQWPEVDFDSLREINDDIVGWIYIPDTVISYPVLQGSNNDQYLYRFMTGKYNGAGSIFLDAEVAPDFSDRNNPIYGHNMNDGSMFASLMGYKNQEFFDAHPKAYLMTPEKNYVVHLFSGYVMDALGNAWDTTFSDNSFQQWLDGTLRRSYFSSDVVPTVEDKVLTFSTCSYEVVEGRFLIHGVLEEYIEATEDTAG